MSTVPDQGMHLIAYLRNGASDTQIEEDQSRRHRRARHEPLLPRAQPKPALMLGFSGFPRS